MSVQIPEVQYIMPGEQATLSHKHRVAYNEPHGSAVEFRRADTCIARDELRDELDPGDPPEAPRHDGVYRSPELVWLPENPEDWTSVHWCRAANTYEYVLGETIPADLDEEEETEEEQ